METRPSKQFFTKYLVWSETSMIFHLAEKTSTLEPTFWGQRIVKCKQQSSQYPIFPSQAQPDQSFTRAARNEKKYQKILDAADFAKLVNCSFIRLNDVLRKNFAQGSQKSSKTTYYESRVQAKMRTDFKLTYRENYGKVCMKKLFFGGRGW